MRYMRLYDMRWLRLDKRYMRLHDYKLNKIVLYTLYGIIDYTFNDIISHIVTII